MHTWHVSNAVIDAYLRDFMARLEGLQRGPAVFPTVWCPIGGSGEILARRAMAILDPVRRASTVLCPVDYDRPAEKVLFRDDNDRGRIPGAHVLLLDSSVHTGWTMKAVRDTLASLKPEAITSYTLVLKRNSIYVPNYFGFIIDDSDRALFLLDELPNNRMMPVGSVRRLLESDAERPALVTDNPATPVTNWSLLSYWLNTDPTREVYVYELQERIVAYISFRTKPGKELLVDAICVDRSHPDKRCAGWLLRWSETCARWADCRSVALPCLSGDVAACEGFGYHQVKGMVLSVGTQKYQVARKPILYNLPLPTESWSREDV